MMTSCKLSYIILALTLIIKGLIQIGPIDINGKALLVFYHASEIFFVLLSLDNALWAISVQFGEMPSE